MINVKIRAQHESTVYCKPVGGGTQIIPTVSTCDQENVEKRCVFYYLFESKNIFKKKCTFFFQNFMKFCGTFVFLVEE